MFEIMAVLCDNTVYLRDTVCVFVTVFERYQQIMLFCFVEMLAGNAIIKHNVMFEMMRNSSLMRNCRLPLLNQVLHVHG